MKYILVVLICLSIGNCFAQEFQSLGAQAAQRKYNTAMDKYKQDLERLEAQKALVEETYKKELQAALTNATKAGNLDEALRIKQVLEGSDAGVAGNKPDDNKKNADLKIQFPKNIFWENVSSKKTVKNFHVIQDVAQGHSSTDMFNYIKNATFKDEIFGKKPIIMPTNTEGLITPEAAHGNSNYCIFYLNCQKDTELELELMYSPHGKVKCYLDFEEVGSGKAGYTKTTLSLTKGMHVLVIDYVNTWAGRFIRLKFPDTMVQVGTVKQ